MLKNHLYVIDRDITDLTRILIQGTRDGDIHPAYFYNSMAALLVATASPAVPEPENPPK